MSDDVTRRAGWLPEQKDLEAWLTGHRARAGRRPEEVELAPVMQEFERLLRDEPLLRMDLERMVAQVPAGKQYADRPYDGVDELLAMVDELLTMAPEFGDGMVSTPLAAVLDWTMGTTAGFAAYRDPRLNAMLKKVLDAWCEFLSSEASLTVLNDSETGWKSPEAIRTLGMDQFEHDPDDEHWGFRSWNDFFTRRFRPGARPVDSPDDDAVIVQACESTPYAITSGVQERDEFWIKSQPYSLADMLAGDESVPQFVGGTVYQAFLSADDHHHWHSPVAGTVVRAFLVPGTYFSEADTEGPGALDPADSQGYITHVAARAVLIIDADDPAVGLVAFVAVGMVEVSSCVFDPAVQPGAHLEKGAPTGFFQFGGSTHCLVFRPGVIDSFSLDAEPHAASSVKRVNTRLATARRA